MIRLLALAALTISLADKTKLPSDADRDAARAKVREILKADFAKNDTSSFQSLADKLLKLAGEDTSNPATFYALLGESLIAAGRATDIARMVRAGKEINQHFDAPDLPSRLGDGFMSAVGAKDNQKTFRDLAAAELSGDAKDRLQLARHWQESSRSLKPEGRSPMLARARFLIGEALVDLKGLNRTEAEKNLREVTSELDAADAKMGRFSIYAGRWQVQYENKYTREYVITPEGALTWEKGTSPDSKPFVAKEEQKAKLTRRGNAVVIPFAGGTILEKLTLDGDKLIVDRYHPATLYPTKAPSNKGVGERQSQP